MKKEIAILNLAEVGAEKLDTCCQYEEHRRLTLQEGEFVFAGGVPNSEITDTQLIHMHRFIWNGDENLGFKDKEREPTARGRLMIVALLLNGSAPSEHMVEHLIMPISLDSVKTISMGRILHIRRQYFEFLEAVQKAIDVESKTINFVKVVPSIQILIFEALQIRLDLRKHFGLLDEHWKLFPEESIDKLGKLAKYRIRSWCNGHQ